MIFQNDRLRRILRNNRKPLLVAFLVFLFVFMAREHRRGHIEGDARRYISDTSDVMYRARLKGGPQVT